jgi:GTP diphosphokinase / guanosine-3',5'-bis(diphosphate) 3'-diphosphatase
VKFWNPDLYMKAWKFASEAHRGQFVPGTEIAYIHHVGGVAMEAMTAIALSQDIQYPDLVVQCALLHDVIEDTQITHSDIKQKFGIDVADGVLALTKDETLPTKQAQMSDSLARIKSAPREVWIVKLSDRIINLQPPPQYWPCDKIKAYSDEAFLILETLGVANNYLAGRMKQKISEYQQYF